MRRSRWGFAAVMWLAMAAPAGAADRVFVGGYGGGAALSFVNLDGSGGGDVPTDRPDDETFGIAVDAAAGRVYFAEDSGSRIVFANLDGTGGAAINTTGATVNNPEGLALDPIGRRVYWSGANKISYANLDGSGGGDLDTTGATIMSPAGLALDVAHNRVYWANDTASGTIGYANLDGTGGGGTLGTGAATITEPIGVALDLATGRVYWANHVGGKISYANLDGSGGADLDTTGATPFTRALGVAIDHAANRIYWANYDGAGGVSYANLDGTGGGGDLNTTGATLNGPAMPALLKAPAAAGPPAITGASTAGSVLSCSPGTWVPDDAAAFLFRVPQAITYRWSRDGADIAGAAASTLTASDPGTYRCAATATNAAGAKTQSSGDLAVVASPPPPLGKPVLTALRAKRNKGATVFSFRLDQAAAVTIVIRRTTGRKAKVATLRRTAKAGLNSVTFRRRKAGRYRATFTPRTTAGAGAAKSVSFRIVRRKPG